MSTDQTRSYFDRFSGRWSNHYAENGRMVGRIARFRDGLAAKYPSPARVLDFGCGSGEIARALARLGHRVSAVDLSAGMLERAREGDPQGIVEWRDMDSAGALPFPDESFDVLVSSSVLEYVENPQGVLAEFARVLRPGGWALFTVPDPRHPERRREERIAAWSRRDPVYCLLRLTRWEPVHTYLRISRNRWSAEEWGRLLAQAGFRLDSTPPCGDSLMMIEAVRRP